MFSYYVLVSAFAERLSEIEETATSRAVYATSTSRRCSIFETPNLSLSTAKGVQANPISF